MADNSPASHETAAADQPISSPGHGAGPTSTQTPSAWCSLRNIIFVSWLNLLLIFIPISWTLNFAMKDRHTLVFVSSSLAIIPLSKLLAFATEELSNDQRAGSALAGLLSVTSGNVIELLIAIHALVKCQLIIVQSTLIGSILSNLLLNLGMCFFASGTKNQNSDQEFHAPADAQLDLTLLTLSVIAILLPAAQSIALVNGYSLDDDDWEQQGEQVLQLSRGVAIILLIVYGSYLVFRHGPEDFVKKLGALASKCIPKFVRRKEGDTQRITPPPTPAAGTHNPDIENGNEPSIHDEPEANEPQLSRWMTIGLLTVVTALATVTAEWLVGSINGLTNGGTISKEFVGVILLPIVGNAAEHVTAITASKNKLTLSVNVAVGSSIQIALFVIPLIVTLGWILDKPLTLLFDLYKSIALFLAVLTVSYVVQDGRSNWLEGMVLLCLYLILAVTLWFYPGAPSIDILPLCV